MKDVFTGDSFLLYSPGVSDTLRDCSVALWFNLISFNGACWQSFGPIAWYQSFTPDDIFFFATEVNPHIESEDDVVADIEKSPVPYMMLLSGSGYPRTVSKSDEMLYVLGEYDTAGFDVSRLKKDFSIKHVKGVYELTLNKWDIFPHLSTAYYDENKQMLQMSAMTDRGYEALVKRLNAYGLGLPEEPGIRLHIAMLSTAKEILRKKIEINPYESLFTAKPSRQDSAELRRINHFLKFAMNDINDGKEPDVEALAQKAGIDVDHAHEILKNVMEKANEMRGKRGDRRLH